MHFINRLFKGFLSQIAKVIIFVVIFILVLVIQKQNNSIFAKTAEIPEVVSNDASVEEIVIDDTYDREIEEESHKQHLSVLDGFANSKIDAIIKAEEEASKKEAEANKESEEKKKSESGKKVLAAPNLFMGDAYPSACEVFSTNMMLNYWGFNYSVEDIINILPISYLHNEGGELVGQSPNTSFIGDPHNDYAFCCYEPVINSVLSKIVGNKKKIVNCTGQNLKALCDNYINKDEPVVIWATIDMKPSYPSTTWKIEGTNQHYTWPGEEHCMLLVGYDNNNYYFNDPNRGCTMKFDKAVSEKRYEEIGMQAVTVTN